MLKQRLCKHCRKAWLRSLSRKTRRELRPATRGGRKLKTLYPSWLYHSGDGSLCPKHAAERNDQTTKRRVHQHQATPAWADKKAIRAMYEHDREWIGEGFKRCFATSLTHISRSHCGFRWHTGSPYGTFTHSQSGPKPKFGCRISQ